MEEQDTTQQQQQHSAATAERTHQMLLGSVVLEDMERQYLEMRQERDALQGQLQRMQEQAVATDQVQTTQQEWERKLTQQRHETDLAQAKIRALEEETKLAKERTDRTLAEGDHLREEISRLSKTNTGLSKNVASMETASRLQENEAIPLFREKERLQTELDTLQAHSNWLNRELEAKSQDFLRLKQEAQDRSLQFHLQLNHTTDEKDAAEARLEAAKQMERKLQTKIQEMSDALRDAQDSLVNAEQNATSELRQEQRLVEVQKEQLQRWEERHSDLARENETLKNSAAEAMALSQKELEDQRVELEAKYRELLEEQKTQMQENKLLHLPASTTTTAITAVRRGEDENAPPMGLTELYTALEETKVAWEQEKIQSKHWEMQFQQVQKEIEDSHPRMRRQALEHELAVDKVREYEQRLEQTIADRDDALAEAKESRQEVSNLRRALNNRKAESDQLAHQVQALLCRISGGQPDGSVPTSIRQIQEQNQQLLFERSRLEDTVEDLKAQLDSNHLRQTLAVTESQLSQLRQVHATLQSDAEKMAVQRDLYMGLAYSESTQLLGSEEKNAVDVLQKEKARSKQLQERNEQLEGEIAAARSDRDKAVRDKESMSERLGRYQDRIGGLQSRMDDLEQDLTASRGEIARATSRADYHKGKSTQAESALEGARHEISHLEITKKELQKVNAELQQSLSNAHAAVSRAEEEKRLLESNERLLQTQLETAKSTETRVLEENSQMRAEMARQGGITDSVRRIEAALTAKSESEQEALKENLERMTTKMSQEEEKHASEVDNLNARIQENEMRLQDLQNAKQRAVTDAMTSEKLLMESKSEVKAISDKCSALETQLQSAKRRLGESDTSDDPEVSMQARINDLVSQIEIATTELTSAKERAKNYEKMSQDNEEALSIQTRLMDEFKKEKEQELSSLKQQLDDLKKETASKQETIKGLTNELSGQKEEQVKTVSTLEAEIAALKLQVENSEKNLKLSSETELSLKMDLEGLRNEVALAQNNYERELHVHSQARSSLRETQEKVDEQKSLLSSAEARADSARKDLEQQRGIWAQEKKLLHEEVARLEKTLAEARGQNTTLHDQLETLGSMVEKAQTSTGDSAANIESVDLQNTIAALREALRVVRSENKMLQTQLDTAKRTAERERCTAAITQRNLDEARAEMTVLQSEKSAIGDSKELETKLETRENHIKVLSDSNKLLRDENEVLQTKVRSLGEESDKLKAAAQPAEDLNRDLNEKIASLEAEKESLQRDLAAWKQRVNSLVSKFNQVDPEEHKKLQEKVADLEKEQEQVAEWKKTKEEESQRLKDFGKNLNKKIQEQKSSIDRQTSEIRKLTAEKEKLAKSSSAGSEAAKERDGLKKTVEKMSKGAESAKKELEGANTQNDRLRATLRKFQTKIRTLEKREEELASEIKTLRAKEATQKEDVGKEETKSGAAGQVTETGLGKEPVPAQPSDKQPPRSLAAQNTTSLRADAAAFSPKAASTAPAEKKSVTPNKQAEAKTAAPPPRKRKAASDGGTSTSKPAMRRLSGDKKELSMKEKLIEKKRRMEEMKRKQALAAGGEKPEKKAKLENKTAKDTELKSVKKSAPGSNSPLTTTKPVGKGAAKDTKKVVSGQSDKERNVKSNAGDQKKAEGAKVTSVAASGTDAEKDKPKSGAALSKPPFGIGGSSAPTSFGQSSSVAGSAAPTGFGASASTGGSAGSSALGGAFLNMKPPGSSGTLPSFSFGGSSSIKLPTPDIPAAAAPSPFGAFGSGTSFGSPFGSSGTPVQSARPLFGSSAPKESGSGETGEKKKDRKGGEA